MLFAAAACLAYLAFNCFFKLHYSIDAFSVFAQPSKGAASQLQSGRYFYWMVCLLVNKLGLSPIDDNILWVSILMCALSFSISTLTIKITSYLKRDTVTAVLTFLLVSLSFIHIFMAEWFQFTEANLMYSIAIFCAVCAVLVFPLDADNVPPPRTKSAFCLSFSCAFPTIAIK